MALAAVVTQSQPTSTASYWPNGLRESLGLDDINEPLSGQHGPGAQIQFHPDPDVYRDRRAARVREGGLEKVVPSGWPVALDGPLVWEGNDFHDDTDFVYNLSDADRAEIKAALQQVKEKNLAFDQIKEDTFVLPGLTEAQAEALDAVHFIARKYKLNFKTEKGDMRFINNFAILHGREAYSDHALGLETDKIEQRSQRHLFRLWLHNEELAWKLPPALKLVWGRTFDKTRPRTWAAAASHPSGAGTGPQPPPPAFPCD